MVVGVITFLVLVNAFYVCAEFAAVGSRRSRIHQIANEGNLLARRLLRILDDRRELDRYVAVCQIGITASAVVLGAFGEANLAPLLGSLLGAFGDWDPVTRQSAAAIIVLIGLSVVQMILSELVPKSIALQYPTQCGLFTVVPLEWSRRLFAPIVWLLNGCGALVLRMIGIRLAMHRHIHSQEEIELLIAESGDGGLLAPEERRRLHQASRLRMRRVKELMVPRAHMVVIPIDASIDEVVRTALQSPYGRFPVVGTRPDEIFGVVYTKDVLMSRIEQVDRIETITVRTLMRPVFVISEAASADELLKFFRKNQTEQGIVIGERREVTGLVTLDDVLSLVFGGVPDEFKGGKRARVRGRSRFGIRSGGGMAH